MARTRSQRIAAVVLTVAVSTALTGCSASPEYGRAGCVPRFTVTPDTARAGETVTFSTTDECDVDVPGGGWRIEVSDSEGHRHEDRAHSDERFDGSWSVSVPLPAEMQPGDGMLSIANWDYSSCPGDASCAGPFGNLTVTRAASVTGR
ncbi:hypothetical protein SAMN02800687_0360 [Curtobacterium sp. UNCCL20]|uniref:hypothetical protein n=1 Tax=Curtobacterium sp. UNCCL20 TaxID=1502773 RepID=UPI0008866917|nr:hypothetical protein [Curtobacterium sp. UNCCL20]SDQ11086.1 hypothetical protein SAMN02800687_0360 [Curtobacterium sp. UNCCL20]